MVHFAKNEFINRLYVVVIQPLVHIIKLTSKPVFNTIQYSEKLLFLSSSDLKIQVYSYIRCF